jgi:hypothetical protein
MYQKDRLRKLLSANRRSISCFLLPLFFFFFVIQSISGQEPAVSLFHGIVLDSETGQPLYGAHFIIGRRATGSADSKGLVSFYAHDHDTVRFTCIGYKDALMILSDTLFAREYAAGIFMTADTLKVPDVVILPRVRNIRAEILSKPTLPDQETANAINNLKISAYQGRTGVTKLGDPAANYELLRQQQQIDAIKKGGIPSSAMVSVSPFTLIPLIFVLAKGLPEEPPAPQPYISQKDLEQIIAIHDSLIFSHTKK